MKPWQYGMLLTVVSIWGAANHFHVEAVSANVNSLRTETKRLREWNETHPPGPTIELWSFAPGDPWGHKLDGFGLTPGDPRGRLRNGWKTDVEPKEPAEVKPGDLIPPQRLPFLPQPQVEVK
jgi:hypothetical protein